MKLEKIPGGYALYKEKTIIGTCQARPTEQGAEILDVYENTPASEAGLKAGDMVTAVDGMPTANMELEELSTLVVKSGEESTELTIHREGEDDFTPFKNIMNATLS